MVIDEQLLNLVSAQAKVSSDAGNTKPRIHGLMDMKYLKALWLFVSYLFWPQWGRHKDV